MSKEKKGIFKSLFAPKDCGCGVKIVEEKKEEKKNSK